jgi:hypothetical protein
VVVYQWLRLACLIDVFTSLCSVSNVAAWWPLTGLRFDFASLSLVSHWHHLAPPVIFLWLSQAYFWSSKAHFWSSKAHFWSSKAHFRSSKAHSWRSLTWHWNGPYYGIRIITFWRHGVICYYSRRIITFCAEQICITSWYSSQRSSLWDMININTSI